MDESALNAFLDAAETGEASHDTAAETPAAPAEDATPAPEATATEPAVEPDVFSRDYVETLRKEAAGYRTRAKELEQFGVFNQYAEEDRAVWLSLAQRMADDPRAGAAEMKRIAEAMLAEATDDTPTPTDEPQYLTRADLERYEAEKEQRANLRQIEATATDLGYHVEAGDRDYVNLLLVANRETAGDVRAAHEKIQAERQQMIDDAIAKFVADRAAEAGGSPVVPPVAGSAPSGQREIKDFRDVRAAMAEFLGA